MPKYRKKKANWVSAATLDLIKARDSAKAQFKRNLSQTSKAKWKELNNLVDKSYINDDVKYLEEFLERMVTAEKGNRLRTRWQIINEVSGKKRNNDLFKVRKKDGSKYYR